MTQWLEVPEEQQKRWGWLEYSLTVKCVCGKDVELYDADLDSNDDCAACSCGRMYSVRLVYQESVKEDFRHSDGPDLKAFKMKELDLL